MSPTTDSIVCRIQNQRIWITSPAPWTGTLGQRAKRIIAGDGTTQYPGLQGRKWHDEPINKWSVPATPTSAANIKLMFTDWPAGTYSDDPFSQLLQQAGEHARANQLRHATELPAIPARFRCQNWRGPCPSTLPTGFPGSVPPFFTDDQDQRTKCPHCDEPVGSWLHQRQAYAVTAPRGRGLLWVGMGAGKSGVTVALADTWNTQTALILATPNSSLIWPDQFDWHSKRKWLIANHGGLNTRTGKPLASPSAAGRIDHAEKTMTQASAWKLPCAIVIPYPLLTYMKDWLYGIRSDLDLFVADESHYLKEPGGTWRRIAQAVASKVEHSLCLTGTLMPNSKLDAYAQVSLIDEAVFGTSFVTHRARYALLEKEEVWVRGKDGPKQQTITKVKGFQHEDEFNQRLANVTYQVGDEVLDLPPHHHVQIRYRLSSKCSKLYRQLEAEFVAESEKGTIVARNPLAKLLRLAQLANGHTTIERDCTVCGGYWEDAENCQNCKGAGVIVTVGEKIDDSFDKAVSEWLSELPVREPVIGFARFVSDLDTLKSVSAKQERRYGELSGRRDDGLTQSGTMPEHIDVDGVQIQAGSEGINFTRAAYHAYLSVGFDNGKYEQSLRRGRRPGQSRPVTYIHFIAELDTGEATVNAVEYAALLSKTAAAEACAAAVRNAHQE